MVLSYFSGIDGNCPAEWVDDKLDSLGKLGGRVVLISGVGSRPDRSPHVTHYRVPSLSLKDLRTEWNELKNSGQAAPWSIYLMFPFALIFGFLLDCLQTRLTKGFGGGKWSWFVPALPAALSACLVHRCKLIVTTGGPASAHLAGIVAGRICWRKVISELQDPMSGHDIGRNSRSAKFLGAMESMICRVADKTVYVTEQAAVEARKTYPGCRIEHVYPGARRIPEVEALAPARDSAVFRMVHLGTLYSTRNMNTLISAIDLLIERGELSAQEIAVDNLGEIYGDIKAAHLAKPYVKQYPIQPRAQALKAAKGYDASLLIQHTDERSKVTMPYKTYDYLNLGNPILALTNNPELSALMIGFGNHAVQVTDVEAIADTLLKLVRSKKKARSVARCGFDPVEQCAQLIKL